MVNNNVLLYRGHFVSTQEVLCKKALKAVYYTTYFALKWLDKYNASTFRTFFLQFSFFGVRKNGGSKLRRMTDKD